MQKLVTPSFTCVALALLLAPAGSAAQSATAPDAPRDRLAAIDRLLARGDIDEETALIYKLRAFRAPEALPDELRALPESEVSCATPVLLDAYQRAMRGELSSAGMLAYKQASSRPASAGSYDSDIYPMRVHYTRSDLASKAQTVLGYAESSWERQVGEIGFRAPLAYSGVDGAALLDIYVGDAHGAGGFTAPEFENTLTTDTDCTTWIVISEELSAYESKTTVAHELNHAMQAAYDCNEWIAFWENTATYVQDLTYDSVNDYVYFLPEFQANPDYPFELFDDGGGYQYGGMLVALTLDEAYGPGDGSVIREIWERCPQSSYYNNEPDYFDAIDALVNERGGDGIDDFQRTLTEWRYLAGTRDDGMHYSEGGQWDHQCWGDYCDVPHLSTQPPANGTRALYAHGSDYVYTALGGVSGVLTAAITGMSSTRWAASIICLAGAATTVTPIEVGVDGVGVGQAQADGHAGCTLAVSALGPAVYDPDANDYAQYSQILRAQHSYTYSLSFEPGAQIPQPCLCDATYDCDEGCPCDADCSCSCDVTTGCDEDCDCDPECDGCLCTATPAEAGLIALAGVLALAVVRRKRARM